VENLTYAHPRFNEVCGPMLDIINRLINEYVSMRIYTAEDTNLECCQSYDILVNILNRLGYYSMKNRKIKELKDYTFIELKQLLQKERLEYEILKAGNTIKKLLVDVRNRLDSDPRYHRPEFDVYNIRNDMGPHDIVIRDQIIELLNQLLEADMNDEDNIRDLMYKVYDLINS